jgi:adenylate cyclase
MSRAPGSAKYARPERERRWLVTSPPADAGDPLRIEDRYLDGTRLRLRRVAGAGSVVFKLGQKVRAAEHDPSLVWVTTFYLSEEEYRRLAVLPAAVLVKTRRQVAHGSLVLAVDEFAGPLRGLVLPGTGLAGTELPGSELPGTEAARTGGEPLDLPCWLGPEVTLDERYTGAALARHGRPGSGAAGG